MRLRHLLLLAAVGFFLSGCSLPRFLGGGLGKVSLTYWGLFEGEDVFRPVINDYNAAKPNVTMEYSQKSYSTLAQLKETILTRLKEGKAADIMRVHYSWVKELSPYLAPLPKKIMAKEEFADTFYPAAREALTVNGEIYGLPLHYEGLLLLANRTLLDEAQVTFPQTWDQFRDAAVKLTQVSGEARKITQAGAAIGVSSNIPHAADILTLMFLQADVRIPEDLASQQAVDALTFFTNFFRVDKVWDESLPPSLIAFSRGQVAFVFAPSWRILEVKELNPGLDLLVGRVPQVPDLEGRVENEVNLASFWVEVVAKASRAKETAFDFLKFLVSADSLKKLYAIEASKRLFGEAYSRKDLAGALSDDPYLAVLVRTAPLAKTALTLDASGNDQVVDALNRAIADSAGGADTKTALENAQKNIEQIISKIPSTK